MTFAASQLLFKYLHLPLLQKRSTATSELRYR